MHSPHEGYAVLLEEVEELWDEVKAGNGTSHRGVSEAVQTAAMAIRYLVDLCDEALAKQLERSTNSEPSESDPYGIAPPGSINWCPVPDRCTVSMDGYGQCLLHKGHYNPTEGRVHVFPQP